MKAADGLTPAADKHSETSRRHVPDAAACYCMLGKLYAAHGDARKAIDCHVEALKINSFMWDAFTGLCDMGAVVRPQNVFAITPDMLATISHPPTNGHASHAAQHHEGHEPRPPFVSTPDVDPFNPSARSAGDVGLGLGGANLFPMASRVRTKTNPEGDQTDIPRPVYQNGHKRTVSGHALQQSQHPPTQPSDPTAAPPRRSVRLLNSITQIRPSGSRQGGSSSKELETKERREMRKARAAAPKVRSGTASTVGRVVSGNRKPHTDASEPSKPESRPASVAAMAVAPPPRMAAPLETSRDRDVLVWLLDLLLKIGSGYRHLSRYDADGALEAFTAVPRAQRETPWVLAQIGKAHYERAHYAEAGNMFRRIREMTPSSLEHMEVYSNTLWQLKDEVALAHLAHTLMDQDRLSPQAWCALGNASSLDRQHDDAVKCFSRATQLDPKFAYAFTLQGHEHVANEEFDKAMAAYRNAISADNRHYNGWYGLGNVYERMGKYEVAEKHYRAAAEINQNNAMILVRIGLVSGHFSPIVYSTLTSLQVLDRMKKIEPALVQFDHALRIDPRSVMARFRRSQVLLKLNAPEDALKELLFLKDAAPDDPNIHFLLGRCYKKLRDRASAIRHLTIAMNLDPKSHGVIKEVMESIDQEDDGGWSSEDEH
jgi:anaphase-promoting complex subunit 3